jgi:hypothetical protein
MSTRRTRFRVRPAWWVTAAAGVFFAYAMQQSLLRSSETTAVSREAGLYPFIGQLVADELRDQVGDARYPDVRARLLSSPDLSAKGTQRLSRAELDELNGLRLRLARASNGFCQAMWTGQTDLDASVDAMNTLPDGDLRAWARLMAHAAILEIDDASAPPREDVPAEALDQIAARLPSHRREAFRQTLQRGLNAPAADGCVALQELMEHAPALDEFLRERTLRAFMGR